VQTGDLQIRKNLRSEYRVIACDTFDFDHNLRFANQVHPMLADQGPAVLQRDWNLPFKRRPLVANSMQRAVSWLLSSNPGPSSL
jgi:hypothetical protein